MESVSSSGGSRCEIATRKCVLSTQHTVCDVDVVVVFCRSNVVICLSEHVRNDTLLDKPHRITKQCRKQLKFELLQRVCILVSVVH